MGMEKGEFQKYDDIDLAGLIILVWNEKWKIALATGVAALCSVIYALSLPNVYKSELLLTSVSASSGGRGALSELGGLASLAGVSLGSAETDEVSLGLVTLTSRVFLTEFINRREILVPLMALESWDSGDIQISEEIYDVKQSRWVEKKPSLQHAYKTLLSKISMSKDPENGIIRVSITSKSPELAQNWVTWLIQDLNAAMRKREISEASRAILYLEEKLNSEASVDMRSMLFRLLQNQTEAIMLASVRADYLFRVVDPAVIPENKTAPNRALICILGTLFGGFVATVLVLIRSFFRMQKSS